MSELSKNKKVKMEEKSRNKKQRETLNRTRRKKWCINCAEVCYVHIIFFCLFFFLTFFFFALCIKIRKKEVSVPPEAKSVPLGRKWKRKRKRFDGKAIDDVITWITLPNAKLIRREYPPTMHIIKIWLVILFLIISITSRRFLFMTCWTLFSIVMSSKLMQWPAEVECWHSAAFSEFPLTSHLCWLICFSKYWPVSPI